MCVLNVFLTFALTIDFKLVTFNFLFCFVLRTFIHVGFIIKGFKKNKKIKNNKK
jgi:hypothetical protein